MTYILDACALIIEQIHAIPVHIIDTIDTTIFTEASRLKAHYAVFRYYHSQGE